MTSNEQHPIDIEATPEDWVRAHTEQPKPEARQYVADRVSAAACNQPEVPEKDHQSKVGGSAHMSYNSDGFFMPAAACFVYNKFKAST